MTIKELREKRAKAWDDAREFLDSKAIAFGDMSYYWIADRQGRSLKRLNELFAMNGQIGFLASQRVDGKLILPEAVKTLTIKGTSTAKA